MVFRSGWYLMTLVVKASSRLESEVQATWRTNSGLDSVVTCCVQSFLNVAAIRNDAALFYFSDLLCPV